jgi:hypothetical protein
MGLEHGLPWWRILRWAYQQIEQDPAFSSAAFDEAAARVCFTVRTMSGAEQRYEPTIERGLPRVEKVEAPPETRS